jgi:hypothetical protein
MIPQERVNDAIAAGGKLGVYMRAPDGSTGIIPRENLVKAQSAGGKLILAGEMGPTQAERQPTQNGPASSNPIYNFASNFDKAVVGTDNPADVVNGPIQAVAHPGLLWDSLKNMWVSATQSHVNLAAQGNAQMQQPGLANKLGGAARTVLSGVPVLGPAVQHVADQVDSGDLSGAAGTAAGLVAPMVAASPAGPAMVDAVTSLPKRIPTPGGMLAGRMAETAPGSQFSRQAILNDAQAHGVNLDLAQATDHPLLNTVKKGNQPSIAANGMYNAAATRNLDALGEWASDEASRYSPATGGREASGPLIQRALASDVEEKSNAATQIYNELDKNVGNGTPDATSVYEKAQKIVNENQAYYDKNPGLKQSQAWRIVNDIADRGKPPVEPAAAAARPEGFETFASGVQPKPKPAPAPDTWTDLQKMRTDLMSIYRSPEIVGSRAEGWLKQLAGTIDDSMTGAGSGLRGQDLANFREANGIWESIKSTYDNPQSPLYHALRSDFPSQIPKTLSSATPELARSVREVLGNLEGPFQREFVERQLNGKDGVTLDLSGLDARLKRLPQDHLEAMLGPEGADRLRMLGKVAQKVTADANPSGSAKVGVPAAELMSAGAALVHPMAIPAVVGEFAMQRGIGKFMNNPKMLKWLTENPQPPRTASAATMSKWLNARQAQIRALGLVTSGTSSHPAE